MKTLITAALMATAVSLATLAAAQSYDDKKPGDPAAAASPVMPAPQTIIVPPVTGAVMPGGPTVVPDGRALASDAQVASARRYYRAQCNTVENPGFCECVTAGVAQALTPDEVRIAARTVGDRLPAQGDAEIAGSSDATNAMSSAERIAQIEGHYADACAGLR
jgi:hypothetical protein